MKRFLDRAERVLTNRNNYLLILFVVYVILIPCFALIYMQLYRGNHQRFAFNQDIVRAQQQIIKASTEREVDHGKRLLEQVRHLSIYLAEAKTPKLQFPEWYESYILKVYGDQYHYECIIQFAPAGAAPGPRPPPQNLSQLIIRRTDGQEIERLNLTNGLKCPAELEEAKLFSTKLVLAVEQDLAHHQTRSESLAEEYPEVWSYWDFVYFSTITQTTVGYGDIIPNSTSVRVVVVAQLIMGTALLVVGVNFVLRGKNKSDNRDSTK